MNQYTNILQHDLMLYINSFTRIIVGFFCICYQCTAIDYGFYLVIFELSVKLVLTLKTSEVMIFKVTVLQTVQTFDSL